MHPMRLFIHCVESVVFALLDSVRSFGADDDVMHARKIKKRRNFVIEKWRIDFVVNSGTFTPYSGISFAFGFHYHSSLSLLFWFGENCTPFRRELNCFHSHVVQCQQQ